MTADTTLELLRRLANAAEGLRRAYETRTPTIVHRALAELDLTMTAVREHLDMDLK
jgi:hypothetical protein